MRYSVMSIFSLLVTLAFASQPLVAGIAEENKQVKPDVIMLLEGKADDSDWSGTWAGKNGAELTLIARDGFIDGWGRDQASFFRFTCILEDVLQRNKAVCMGQGAYKTPAVRFLYSTELTLEGTNALSETWQAKIWNPGTNKRDDRSNTERYRKIPSATR